MHDYQSAAPYRFLCDEMLKGFGHWLRAAGYDTEIAEPGEKDRSLIEKALREKRLFLSRDRKLTEFRHADKVVILLQTNGLNEWAAELSAILSVDWLLAPFSRCLLCNTPLTSADPVCMEQVPVHSRPYVTQLLYCQHCDKLFWDGSHVRRMRKVLNTWNGSASINN
jgi:hypothetical protein